MSVQHDAVQRADFDQFMVTTTPQLPSYLCAAWVRESGIRAVES